MEVRSIRKNKKKMFPSSSRFHTAIWIHHMDADKEQVEKASWKLLENAMISIEQILEATSHKTSAVQPPTFHL